MTGYTYCAKCGCSVDHLCRCARGCLLHPTSVTVPTRMRLFITGSSIWDEPKERHGYGDAGDRLVAALRYWGRPRDKVRLDAEMRGVLIEFAESLFDCSADDARYDSDAKNDREAARRMLRKLGVDP
jgi:hypothetical protein